MAIKFGVNLATPNPLHHPSMSPPLLLQQAYPVLCSNAVYIPAQLSSHWLFFWYCIVHHVGDLRRLENFEVRQIAWPARPRERCTRSPVSGW